MEQLLHFDIDKFNDALLLNDRRIFPLDSMPLHVDAMRIPTTTVHDKTNVENEVATKPKRSKRIMVPLRYEHTIFRAEKPGFWWLQFSVKGLHRGQSPRSIKRGQKIVQISLRKEYA
jgi:hypothetical protein